MIRAYVAGSTLVEPRPRLQASHIAARFASESSRYQVSLGLGFGLELLSSRLVS